MNKDFPIIPGADAFFFKGNEIGILICHGFNGTPQSVRYLGEQFAEHGFSVYAPRLHGHGTHPLEMEQCHYEDWIKSIFEAFEFLKQHCREIYVIGQSMGGTLALYLAGINREIAGIVTINVALDVPGYEVYRENFTERFIAEDTPDIKLKDAFEIVYETVPTNAIRNLLHLIDQTKSNLATVSCPALLIKSKVDHVVPPICTDIAYQEIKSCSKQGLTLENSYHVASLDNDKETIVSATVKFIKNHSTILSTTQAV